LPTSLNIAVLPGDGIGPEVTREAVRVLKAAGKKRGLVLECHEHPIGAAAIGATGAPLPGKTLEACLASDAVLLGAIGSPEFDSLPPEQRPETALLGLRKALGGYANLRPVKAYAALRDSSPLRAEVVAGSDLLVVRELLGGLYFGEPRGRTEADGEVSACNTMRYTAGEIERVARVAFEAARKRRGKVTSVDKANILETSQLWREVVTRVGRTFPDVALEHLLVDTCAMLLVANPRRFDVLLTENLFGDVLSDEAAVLAGSLGMLASATIGGAVDLYEPVHGTAPDIAGRDVANPIGAIATAALLLRHTAGLEPEAAAVEGAICDVLGAGYRTADLKGGADLRTVGTTEMGTRIVEALARRL
jgi:3-isopropylmalate dehydrogenase